MTEAPFHTLTECLAFVDRGYNLHHEIALRGSAIRSHIRHGNMRRAEELAFEVDEIQDAVMRRGVFPAYLAEMERKQAGRRQYVLPLEWWANHIVQASLVSRYFRAFPGDADTLSNAVAQAMRCNGIGMEDALHIRPRDPGFARVAAE
jgi:hypothetical protein